ncbi:MAG: 3'-5' exonuclease [Rubrivivax sp.]|nr:3'-5' exonuclease [Rubrivivax sp.]
MALPRLQSVLAACAAWLQRRRRAPTRQGAERRWVVLDVESSGLDPQRDRLLAIAAIAVHVDGRLARIVLRDSFEVLLRQESATPDHDNILLHGIGVGAQRAGVERSVALAAFVQFAGGAPLVAFHAAFDRTLMERACRAEGVAPMDNCWLDWEPLAAVLQPRVRARTLDQWMAALGIVCSQRHQAAADTLATAELMLKLWPALLRELPQPDGAGAVRLAAQRRWAGTA